LIAQYENTIVGLQNEVHHLNNLRDPIVFPGAAEMGPEVMAAPDDGAPDEEEDPEELVAIDESDDEGGHMSSIDNDHDD
jgi:hypothetical protein